MTMTESFRRLPNREGRDDFEVRWPTGCRCPRARPDIGAAGEERGPQPAVGAATAVPGRPARGRRRQPVRRRHAGGRTGGCRPGGCGRSPHRHRVPVQRQPVRRGAPRHARGLGAQPRLLLQLVLRPRADRLLHEVGRRHGPDRGGRRDVRRPRVAARERRSGGRDAEAPAVRGERPGRLSRRLHDQRRGVRLPDGRRLPVRQGLRVGDADGAARHPPAPAAAGAVRGAEVPRQRRVRPLGRHRCLRRHRSHDAQAARVGGLPRAPGRSARRDRGRGADRGAPGVRPRDHLRHPEVAAAAAAPDHGAGRPEADRAAQTRPGRR